MRKDWRLPGAALLLLMTIEGAAAGERWAGISSADHFGTGPCPMVAFTLNVDGVAIEGSAESEATGSRVTWSVRGRRTHDFIQLEMSRRPSIWARRLRLQWTGFQRHGLMQLTTNRDESCRRPRSVNLRRID
ncbi:MAG: hypothetical protein KF889_14015 [Alphaproteobacteria bacterium]|nr:hypothetical protein [Alphaproteobacteria bacterium]MCW5738887.1 hypothetical protein [Alphaproteobacteria bacterium]